MQTDGSQQGGEAAGGEAEPRTVTASAPRTVTAQITQVGLAVLGAVTAMAAGFIALILAYAALVSSWSPAMTRMQVLLWAAVAGLSAMGLIDLLRATAFAQVRRTPPPEEITLRRLGRARTYGASAGIALIALVFTWTFGEDVNPIILAIVVVCAIVAVLVLRNRSTDAGGRPAPDAISLAPEAISSEPQATGPVAVPPDPVAGTSDPATEPSDPAPGTSVPVTTAAPQVTTAAPRVREAVVKAAALVGAALTALVLAASLLVSTSIGWIVFLALGGVGLCLRGWAEVDPNPDTARRFRAAGLFVSAAAYLALAAIFVLYAATGGFFAVL